MVTVTRFSDEDEAVAITNESEYGLTAAIYTADSVRGFRVARRVEAGMVFINNYFRGVLGTPFGGAKHSGYGREHAIETLREFSYTKMIASRPASAQSRPGARSATSSAHQPDGPPSHHHLPSAGPTRARRTA